MTDNFNPKNSIWPNGSKVDENGYVTFYPLGTNKIDVPTTGWPKGTKLVAPFVYDENNRVVGFCDTKAMTTANGNANIYLPYELIQADFSSIEKGTLGVYAPKAVVKNALWADGTVSDFPEAQFKYKGYTTVDSMPSDYLADISNGTWSEPLWDLTDGSHMFWYCDNLETFNSDLSSLTDGTSMFYRCTALTAFSSDLSSLTDGRKMFFECKNLTTFTSDLSSLTNGGNMFSNTKLTSFDYNLTSLTNGDSMFSNCSNLTSFTSDLSSLTNGGSMFSNCYNLTAFNSDLSSLTEGLSMFSYCSNLESFTSDLSSLTKGEGMFNHCNTLSSFTSDLSSLTNGEYMFNGCKNLTTFTSDLSSLTNGYMMFNNTKLTSFDYNLTSLTNSTWMFSSCDNLTTFTSDLNSLVDGSCMFSSCDNLTTFSSDLSSLTNGYNMFNHCKLDTASVKKIAETINTPSSKGTIHIGIGNSTPNTEEVEAFNTIASKNWNVYVNGSLYTPTSPAAITTLDENGEETTTPIPFWAKPVPATEETASYVDANGNYYNILGGQFIYVRDPETYGMFTSLEDAQAQMRLTKYVKGEEPVIIETA